MHQQPFLGSGFSQRGQKLTASMAQFPSVNMVEFLMSTPNGSRLSKTASCTVFLAVLAAIACWRAAAFAAETAAFWSALWRDNAACVIGQSWMPLRWYSPQQRHGLFGQHGVLWSLLPQPRQLVFINTFCGIVLSLYLTMRDAGFYLLPFPPTLQPLWLQTPVPPPPSSPHRHPYTTTLHERQHCKFINYKAHVGKHNF